MSPAIGLRHKVANETVGVSILLFVIASTVLTARKHPEGEECPFDQNWYAGDQHFNEMFEFRDGGTGTWHSGGFAGDAPHNRKDFYWVRTESTLTLTCDEVQVRVSYAIAKPSGGSCMLKFEEHPLASHGGGFLLFTDMQW